MRRSRQRGRPSAAADLADRVPLPRPHVNLLHGLAPLAARGRDRIDAVEVGRHGLRIHRGESSGLLLPTVPVENGWDA